MSDASIVVMSGVHSREVTRPPEKFHSPKNFKFPKRKFGSQGATRSFCSEWCASYTWLHYDATSDAAFCHLCMTAEFEKKFLASTKRDPAFISAGFMYWKEAIAAFKIHMDSACHREAVEAIEILPRQVINKDIGELWDTSISKEKPANRAMFKRILQMILHLNKEKLDSLDLNAIGNQFVQGSEHCLQFFGKFE